MSKRGFEVIGVLAVAAVLVPGLLQAGEVQVGGQGGTGNPPPDDIYDQEGENCDVDIDWNPNVQCSGQEEVNDLDDLLDCMLFELDPLQNSPPQDFQTGLLAGGAQGPWGIEVHRKEWNWFPPPGQLNLVEIQRLEIFENTLGIGTTQVAVNQSGLVVRIGEIVEDADGLGGVIEIVLDDDIDDETGDLVEWVGTFDTATLISAFDLNLAISQWLRGQGFDVQYDGGFFVVTRTNGFRRIKFQSENGHEGGLGPQVLGVVTSDIALLPESDPEIVHLFPPGI